MTRFQHAMIIGMRNAPLDDMTLMEAYLRIKGVIHGR